MNAATQSQVSTSCQIVVAPGDGVGPEIMEATLRLLKAALPELRTQHISAGQAMWDRGITSGIDNESWDAIREGKILLKGPFATPQGSGVKSLNVTLRKSLGLFANVRPCPSYAPFVPTNHPNMNVVVIRENEEDLYAGIEHRQTDEVVQCLKLMSRPGCERIARYAFEYARAHGRKKVTCMTKDNIMKLTDGLFHRVFDEVSREYPGIDAEHMIIDIGAARLATRPERFDVILAPNLYGDIISDIAAEVAGSIGLAPSANIGSDHAMFEAVHGTAPDIAGQDIANPSGLLLAAVMMLSQMGQAEAAAKIHNAWLRTLEDGIHTGDLYQEGKSQVRVGTQAFADAVAERLGQMPEVLNPVQYESAPPRPNIMVRPTIPAVRTVVGVDIFVRWTSSMEGLVRALLGQATPELPLEMVTNRGVRVWPNGFPETLLTDHWRCRFRSEGTSSATQVVDMIARLTAAGLDVIKTETLFEFDGKPGFSLGQGQ